MCNSYTKYKPSRRSAAGLLVPERPSVCPRKPHRWRDIAILACPPQPEPSILTRSRSALDACRQSVHVSHARGHASSQSNYYIDLANLNCYSNILYCLQSKLLPPPPKVMGGYVFTDVGRYRCIGIYVCKQLSGTNSSPIVTELCQSYT